MTGLSGTATSGGGLPRWIPISTLTCAWARPAEPRTAAITNPASIDPRSIGGSPYGAWPHCAPTSRHKDVGPDPIRHSDARAARLVYLAAGRLRPSLLPQPLVKGRLGQGSARNSRALSTVRRRRVGASSPSASSAPTGSSTPILNG